MEGKLEAVGILVSYIHSWWILWSFGLFNDTFEILLCPDKTVSPELPGSRNTTLICPEFTCTDGSCVPFNMVRFRLIYCTSI